MIPDADIAKALGISVRAVEMIRQRAYGHVVDYFQSLRNRDGYAALKRYGHAVDRLMDEFQRVFERPPLYPTMGSQKRHELRKQLALVVERFGNIAPLIKDLRDAGKELQGNARPRSIVWFIKAPEGVEPRWAQLYWRLKEDEERQLKTERENWEPTPEMQKLLDMTGETALPQWVIDARRRLGEISRWVQNNLASDEQKIERTKIINALKDHGYWDPEETAL